MDAAKDTGAEYQGQDAQVTDNMGRKDLPTAGQVSGDKEKTSKKRDDKKSKGKDASKKDRKFSKDKVGKDTAKRAKEDERRASSEGDEDPFALDRDASASFVEGPAGSAS